MLMIPVVQIYQRAFQRSAAVGTIAAVVAAMKRMFTEIRRKQGVFQNFRVKRFRMGRFQKIRQIAVTAAREIRFRDCRRIAVDTGCELQSVKISFIKVDIFRTNEIAYSQKIPAFFRLFQPAPADSGEFIRIVHFPYFIFVRDQIVVEIVGGAVVQAAAVCQRIEFFSVLQAPCAYFLYLSDIPVQLAAQIIAVEKAAR